jgi:hypothetical protein
MAKHALAVLCLLSTALFAQELEKRPPQTVAVSKPPATAQLPNTNSEYQQLRHITLSTESFTVNNLTLKRDVGEFTFRSGTFTLLTPVNGKVTGAVFSGDASFSMVPPTDVEKRSLSILTHGPKIEEVFAQALFRFTDGTEDEIKKQASPGAPVTAGILNEVRSDLHNRTQLAYNFDGRILQDVLSPSKGGLFVAFIHGKKYSGKMIYGVDPHGIPDFTPFGRLGPDEVFLFTYDSGFSDKMGVWAAFHLADEYKTGAATSKQVNGFIDAQKQEIEVHIERSGKLSGTATTRFVSLVDGLLVVPLDLYPTLRAQSVITADGAPLQFVQEPKDEDPQFFVILPKALAAGEPFAITTSYSGKDAVQNAGSNNYNLLARENWYPNTWFGDYAQYKLTLGVPRGLTMVANGKLLRQYEEGKENLSEWETEAPIAVAGFNFGEFKREEAKNSSGMLIESYANKELPDMFRALQRSGDANLQEFNHLESAALGTMDTTALLKKPLAEALIATQVYENFFGKPTAARVSMTQQVPCTFGQAWPNLVYMPICSFFDGTVRHQIGLDDTRGYWTSVAAHEVAHQWWGHTVGWNSYRDQWMSEGFAEFSASLYLQLGLHDHAAFIKFWNDERSLMTEKNAQGYRAIDSGLLTLGYRNSSSKTGSITRRLIYPKGGYILHMLRMMMWSNKTGETDFKAMMHDFVTTYTNQPATTEDFKAMVEKHMTPQMDVDKNHKMDWFFNPYVYGTAFPNYRLDYNFDPAKDGKPAMNIKITQSNVTDDFQMLVPLYIELTSGKIIRVGEAHIVGNSSIEKIIPMEGVKDLPKRALLNYMNDVLCTQEVVAK